MDVATAVVHRRHNRYRHRRMRSNGLERRADARRFQQTAQWSRRRVDANDPNNNSKRNNSSNHTVDKATDRKRAFVEGSVEVGGAEKRARMSIIDLTTSAEYENPSSSIRPPVIYEPESEYSSF